MFLTLYSLNGAKTMASRSAHLNNIFDEDAINALSATLRDVATSKNVTEDELRGLFMSKGLSFDDHEVEQIATYYASHAGIKDREVNRTVTDRFTKSNSSERDILLQLSGPIRPRIAELINLHSFDDLLGNSGASLAVAVPQIEALLASAYDDLSDSDVDEMIAFYTSGPGRKCAAAMRNAGATLLSHCRAQP